MKTKAEQKQTVPGFHDSCVTSGDPCDGCRAGASRSKCRNETVGGYLERAAAVVVTRNIPPRPDRSVR